MAPVCMFDKVFASFSLLTHKKTPQIKNIYLKKTFQLTCLVLKLTHIMTCEGKKTHVN